MLTENDKMVLDAMNTQVVEQLASKVEDFIDEADKLLKVYPEVDFSNAHSTALQSENIANSVKEYSEKVWNNFLKIFGEYQPSAQRLFGTARMLTPEAISEYGTIRNTLTKKRDILVEFKEDLDKYLGK